MRIIEDTKLDYQDVLIVPKRSTLTSRKDVNLFRKFEFKNHGDQSDQGDSNVVRNRRALNVIPIMAANMDGIGTMDMARALIPHGMIVVLHKFYKLPELKKFFTEIGSEKSKQVFYTIGLNGGDFERLEEFSKSVKPELLHNICIDVANGYTERFAEFVKKVRTRFPDKVIMAGNVVTGEMVEQLILSGADIVKIGIGPGSTCLTRKMAGTGYPQLSAIIECADSAHGMGGRICADGGCQVPGDLAKAFGAGADFVMLGGMLSGHKEAEQKIYTKGGKGGKKYLKVYGSSSEEAMKKHNGGMSEYRTSEGRVVEVEYRGKVEGTVHEILGGLRSACTYVGARELRELPRRTTFIKVNNQLNHYFDIQG